MGNIMLDSALAYASQGWPVFPCRAGAKTPLTPRGLHDASTDPAVIAEWWRVTPEANIAVNCGAASLAVVDLDVKNGINGIANWQEYCQAHEIEPNGTMTQATPSGGRHLIYSGSVRNSASIIAPGIDTRGLGGYILLAPSVVGGKRYRLETSDSPAILPLPPPIAGSLKPKDRSKTALKPSTHTSGTLADLIASDGHPLTQKGGLDEYCGPCPWCGGHDRFVVSWTGEGRDGGQRYYCRKCERKGDAASWLIDRRGLPVTEAKQSLNIPVDPAYLQKEIVWPPLEPPPQADPWDRYLIHASEMIENKPPATVWDVEGVIEAGSLVVVYGKPGSLKSMLWADMALAVAAGRMWLPPSENGGSPPIGVRAGSVGWIDLDNGRRRTHHRVHALAHGANVSNPDLYFWSFPPCDLTKVDTLRALERVIMTNHLKMLNIDTLINSMAVKNENDNSELRAPLLALRTLVEVTGCCVCAIHHPKKGQAVGRMSDDLRGGGAIAGALDIAIRIEREEGGHKVKCVATKTRGADIGDIHAEFSCRQNLEGEMETAAWHSVESFGTGDGVETIVDTDYHAMILTTLGSEEVSGNDIFREVKGGKQKLLDALKYLEKNGTIKARTKGQKRLFKVSE